MPKFRTKKKNRTTYIYRDAYGNKVAVLRAGENAVTQADIDSLHADDDAVHNAAKRDSYYGLLHYEQFIDDGNEILGDWQEEDLADFAADPETMLMQSLEAITRSEAFNTVWSALSDKQRELVKKKLEKRSNVDIADEEGCTEAAIRNRLSKIQKHFVKFMT